MRVALADDSGLFRAGLASVLSALGASVVVQAGNGVELMQALARTEPVDVVILDIRMPPSFTNEGLAAAITLRSQPDPPAVLLLSTYAESVYAATLLSADSASVGYLLKDKVDEPRTLWDALQRLTSGEIVIEPSLVDRLMRHERKASTLARLTDQERRVLNLIAEGRSNEGISAVLRVTIKTVEAHVGHIFMKLDLDPVQGSNRRVLAALAWLSHES
jgi:DNA-binding NarL/FixJ family response regulator